MYISVERNIKGNLEIDISVINQQVDFIVSNRVTGLIENSSNVSVHNENNVFIVINLLIKDRLEFETNYNAVALSDEINESIYNSIGLRPKSVSFSYSHK